MKARAPFRKLFTTTSMAALLATGSGLLSTGALAGTTYSSPNTNEVYTGGPTDFITVATTLSNDAGLDGLLISDDENSANLVSNTGTIDISDTAMDEEAQDAYDDMLAGIHLTDDVDISPNGSSTYDGSITNTGMITVDALIDADASPSASESGVERTASGIRVDDGSSAAAINNQALLDITASAGIHNSVAASKSIGLDAEALAFGVDYTGFGSSFRNSGTIDVQSVAGADAETNYTEEQYVADIESEDEGSPGFTLAGAFSRAIAAGVHFVSPEGEQGEVLGRFVNEDVASQIYANATSTALTHAEVNVQCTDSDNECVPVDEATAVTFGFNLAEAYGVQVGPENNFDFFDEPDNDVPVLPNSGGFENNGTIAATANAFTQNSADANTYGSYAQAVAGESPPELPGGTTARGIGVTYDVNLFDGDFENAGTISGAATALVDTQAHATSDGYAEAVADTDVDATAKGVELHAMLLNGGFDNSGRISGVYDVVIGSREEEGDDIYFEPMAASADGSDEAYAHANVTVYASATGIEIQGLSMTDDFRLGAVDENSGIYATGHLHAELSADADADANSTPSNTGEGTASADAHGEYHSDVAGVEFYVTNLSGQFINEGTVSAVSDQYIRHNASSSSYDNSEASADATIDARATGIHIESQSEEATTISGNLYNTGNVTATVTSVYEGTAGANGSGDLEAESNASMYSTAYGMEIHVGELQDNFYNGGTIIATANARRQLVANAYSDRDEDGGTYGDAEAYAGNSSDLDMYDSSKVVAHATGLNLYLYNVGGHIENQGDVHATAQASDTVTANAQAGDEGSAYAYAQSDVRSDGTGIYIETSGVGTGLEYVNNVDEDDGYISNSGHVVVNIAGNSDVHAYADAIEGSAVAEAVASGSAGAGDDANVTAWGLIFEGSESADIGGSIVNEGDIEVYAHLNASINSDAYNSGDDTEDNLAAALAGGRNGAYAAGISISDVDIGTNEDQEGDFWNSGDVYASATATQNTHAEATSQEGIAFAAIGANISRTNYASFDVNDPNFISANAEGITFDDVYVEGSFNNSAEVSAVSYAENNNYAHADGQSGAIAVLNAGTQANGVGLNFLNSEVYGSSEDGGISNYGLFYGEAIAYGNNEAEADSNEGEAKAYIAAYDANELTFGRISTDAQATGVRMSSTYGTSFSNLHDGEISQDVSNIFWQTQGAVGAFALAQTTNYAHADADEGIAEARVSQEDDADAIGVFIGETEDGESRFYNSGSIYAVAGAGDVTGYLSLLLDYDNHNAPEELDFRQEAYANSDEDTATAEVDYSASATATGVDVWVEDFTNDGFIGAFGVAQANTYAHANASDGSDIASASANAYAYAEAVGADVGMSLPGGDVVNTGMIIGQSLANAYAEARIDGNEGSDAYAEASAEAEAYGLIVSASSPINQILNEDGGMIMAIAQANATTLVTYNDDEGDAESGYANANATALLASGINFTTLQNDGQISASATANSQATAVGLKVEGFASYSYSGTIVNNGTIEAIARSDDPYATAILLTDSARVTSITNTGKISADTEDTSDFDLLSADYGPNIAIDIRGAGVPVQINQNDGEIDGNIVMANSAIDHIDWKGGEINGDIFGDYEQDVINIYASTVGDTVYNNFTYDGIIDGADSVSVNGDGHDTAATTLRITNQIRNVASVNVGAMGTLNMATHATIQTDALNLNANSTLEVDINDTDEPANGVINTATADLGGATVKAKFISPWNRTTNEYRIINWDEESDTTFGHVISSDVLTKVTAQYGEDGVDLVMQYLDFGDLTYLEDDATSLGLALDRTWDDIDPDSPIGLALAQLLQLTPDQFAYQMSQIAGQQTADIQSVTLAQLGSLIHVIQTQINESRTLAGDTGGDGVSFSIGSDKMKVSSGEDFKPIGGASAGDPVVQGDWRAWARVFGDWAELKASNTAPGFKSDAAGVVAGADYAPSNGFTVGLAGGYQTSDITFGGQGKGDIESWSATAYMDYEFGNAYVDGLLGYSAQSYDMDRYLTVLGTNYVGNSTYDGGATIAALEAGYKFGVGDGVTLTPFVGLNTTYTTTDGTTETGAGVWNITYDDRSDTQVDSVLGARLSKDFKTDGGTLLTPTVELGWKHGFGDTSPTAGAALAGIPGSQYTIFGSETDADTAIVGAALQAQLTDTVDLYAQYNGQFSGNYSDNTASLRLRLKF